MTESWQGNRHRVFVPQVLRRTRPTPPEPLSADVVPLWSDAIG